MAGTADVAAVVGAVAVVVADTAANPVIEWKDEGGLALLKRVAGLNQLAPIVCAGAAQASVIERGVNELGVSRMRLFGSAPEALRSAIIAIVALEAGAAPPGHFAVGAGTPAAADHRAVGRSRRSPAGPRPKC